MCILMLKGPFKDFWNGSHDPWKEESLFKVIETMNRNEADTGT